ncbi:MAG: hypothetical protein KDA32_08495 [Phycisphaerales bacterium]|nr:hypothetical protein [Phycisphaerales bacterium]
MTFEDAINLMPLYAAGELDADRSAALDALLAESAELRAEFEAWRSLRAATNRALRAEALPAGLHERVMASVSTPGASEPRSKVIRLWPLLAPISLAAAIALAVLISWPSEAPQPAAPGNSAPQIAQRPPDSGNPNIVPAAMVSPQPFAKVFNYCAEREHHKMEGVPLSTCCAARDAIAKRATFSGSVLIPDLSSAGFKLDGVCMCCPFRVEDLHVVHAYYRAEDGRVISLFSLDRPLKLEGADTFKGALREYQVARVEGADDVINGVCVLAWNDAIRDETFAACGRLSEADLQGLADQAILALSPPSVPVALASLPR